jgi:hypothetical protein
MLPIQSGSIILGEYMDNWNEVKVGETYIVVSKNEGVVYKRAGNRFKENKELKLISDNKVYDDTDLDYVHIPYIHLDIQQCRA